MILHLLHKWTGVGQLDVEYSTSTQRINAGYSEVLLRRTGQQRISGFIQSQTYPILCLYLPDDGFRNIKLHITVLEFL